MTTTTQKDAIFQRLLEGKTITSMQAIRMFGCTRLAARIRELRKEGINILSPMKKLPRGKAVAQYRLGTQELAA